MRGYAEILRKSTNHQNSYNVRVNKLLFSLLKDFYDWTSWRSCSKSCGGGNQERQRIGTWIIETRPCNKNNCPSKSTVAVLISLYSALSCTRRFISLAFICYVSASSSMFVKLGFRKRRLCKKGRRWKLKEEYKNQIPTSTSLPILGRIAYGHQSKPRCLKRPGPVSCVFSCLK